MDQNKELSHWVYLSVSPLTWEWKKTPLRSVAHMNCAGKGPTFPSTLSQKLEHSETPLAYDFVYPDRPLHTAMLIWNKWVFYFFCSSTFTWLGTSMPSLPPITCWPPLLTQGFCTKALRQTRWEDPLFIVMGVWIQQFLGPSWVCRKTSGAVHSLKCDSEYFAFRGKSFVCWREDATLWSASYMGLWPSTAT